MNLIPERLWASTIDQVPFSRPADPHIRLDDGRGCVSRLLWKMAEVVPLLDSQTFRPPKSPQSPFGSHTLSADAIWSFLRSDWSVHWHSALAGLLSWCRLSLILFLKSCLIVFTTFELLWKATSIRLHPKPMRKLCIRVARNFCGLALESPGPEVGAASLALRR